MQRQQYSVLIVDDNRSNLRILGATFEDNGFTIYSASSVETAQETLTKHSHEIDLVLSDIQMPGLSGFDLVKWMKAENNPIKDIPILLITSQLPESENRILGLSLGAVDYLLRALDPQELVIRVTQAIERFNHIKNLRTSLESSENLASAGRLFAASNHEIKNITQIIQFMTGILARELHPSKVATSDTCQQALKMLQQSSTMLANVTKMIGGIVGNSETPLGAIVLESLVSQIASLTKPLLKGHIDLSFDAGACDSVIGSETFLQQILINLILNARDAIDESRTDGSGKITIQCSSIDDTFVELKVIDNGAGFPARDTRKSFQPFASTKQMRGGTGLGLWLSSHLAEKMGASLTLESEGPGRGATAKLTLKKVKI